MNVLRLKDITIDQKYLGGKAWGLGQMASMGFPVPDGVVLSSLPTEVEWKEIATWWAAYQQAPVAVRSSASAEDSKEHSFAGQNLSFLNVKTIKELREAVQLCFDSVKRNASKSYRQFFSEKEPDKNGMNIVIQLMVDPKFSGVFFSKDPRQGTQDSGWILEVVPGLGEALVSGKVTPGQVHKDGSFNQLPPGFTLGLAQEVAKISLELVTRLGFEVDVEWAIDSKNEVKILQSRPITTLKNQKTESLTTSEIKRLRSRYDSETVWDGHTFSDWTGLPSPSTLSLWKKVFSPHHAFGHALKTLGYQSFSKDVPENNTLMESVLGRAYINLSLLSDLYYGPIPYRILTQPKPHTEFDWKKINLKVILHTPIAIAEMLKVAWNVTTKRKHWLQKAKTALVDLQPRFALPLKSAAYTNHSINELKTELKAQTEFFSREALHWPLLLVILTESTMQRLQLLLKGVFGEEKAAQMVREYMAHGLHTVTMEMNECFQNALLDENERPKFLKRFGHRGPGEMDLKNPRWVEIKDRLWQKGSPIASSHLSTLSMKTSETVETQIAAYTTYKKEIILEEWKLLRSMLELREQWKMELLKTVGLIRTLINQIGERAGLTQDIHYLEIDEIIQIVNESKEPIDNIKNLIADRKEQNKEFSQYSLPEVFAQSDLERLIQVEWGPSSSQMSGEPLAPGIAQGRVKIIKNAEDADPNSWDESTILVAETTDPGWTPLFAKSSAMIVERGGVLSHCAILAREMGIPAVSGIEHASLIFKDGDFIRVDGNTGKIDVRPN
jgi:phosphohistidine swiveling domain-containing protein